MDGSLVVREGSLSLRFMLLQLIVALSYGRESVVENFVIPMDGNLVIMEGSLLSIFLLL